MTVADNEDNNRVIISRIQQRRGIKQDLPQPLRPAEFGFTTDSRQVFIGGDPSDLSAPYNKNLSYFETTLNARNHTLSIANNQIIAFTVPFIKYSKGKFDGISNLRQWEPNDARTSVTVDLTCDHIGPDYAVFPELVTESYTLPVSLDSIAGDNIIELSYEDFDENPIRIGDAINSNGVIQPAQTGKSVTVASILDDNQVTKKCTIRIKDYANPVGSVANSNITFTQASIRNNLTGESFKNTDINVYKNGIKLEADPDNTIIDRPRSAYDYVIDASNVLATGTHSLTLRTPPTTTEEITVSYYSNTAIVQALSGIPASDGKRYISNNVRSPDYLVESFYSKYNIPEYLEINPELVRLSETTGLGFIGLEKKHISSIAYGNVISNPNTVTLGNLLVARNDHKRGIGNVELVDANNRQVYSFTMNFASENVFSPIGETGVDATYRYNKLIFPETSNVDSYIQKTVCDVVSVDEANAEITVEVPAVSFTTFRNAAATLADIPGNNYGENGANTSIITITTNDTAGILKDDYVRIIDVSGDPANCELNDIIFKVTDDPTLTTFNVQLDSNTIFNGNLNANGNVVTSFTENDSNIAIVNHGNLNTLSGNVEFVLQLYTERKHNFEIDPGNIFITEATPSVFNTEIAYNTLYVYDTNGTDVLRDQDQKTIFIELPTQEPMFQDFNLDVSGQYFPELETLYEDLQVTPVLSVDLSGVTTVKDVLSIVNKDLVTVKVEGNTTIVEDIFPQLTFVPNTTNQLLLKQDPAYSSVDVGGLEFTLFEDYDTPTLEVLGFEARSYTRETDTIRAKLERWLNDVAGNKDINIFSRVMTIGTKLNESGSTVPATYVDYTELGNINLALPDDSEPYKTYPVIIDDVFKEVQFCDRQEASNFNLIVNNAYAESLYDRRFDRFDGVRGLLNLKNNIELLTRESSILFGERELTYSAPFNIIILNEQNPGDPIEDFTLEANRYDSFIIDYTIVDDNTNNNEYQRSGQLRVQVLQESPFPQTAVTVDDDYTSQWDIIDPPLDSSNDPIGGSTDPNTIYEPKFGAEYVGGSIRFFLEEYQDLVNLGADNTAHSLNTDLAVKYVFRRWSSTENL